ncbi:MAG: family 20 glycosylhydrolase [Lentisphaeria bacterium]|nr:family 20 glycosylhydrolase [Lentisphaeria bacterium]
MTSSFKIRAAQIYLARLSQEKIEYVFSYIDFIAEHNYNTLFLYLAQKIRCKTYDPGEGKGYTKDELRSIVQYAKQKNILVIPGLNLFGHAELILSRPEYQDMAELRDGMAGREHSTEKHVFCLTSPAVRKFAASFLEEVLEIFPSPYIHIGCDDALDVGYCKDCRKKIKSFSDEEDLVLEYLHFIRDIVTVKGGRRMMIWDDLLPLYSSLPEKMAKDVIICLWQYHENVPEYGSYCFNSTFKNALKEYREAGHDCIVCPADYTFNNAETFSSYGENENALGIIVTAWPKYYYTPEQTRVTIGTLGLLLSGKYQTLEDSFRACLKGIFGDMPEDFIAAVYHLRSCGFPCRDVSNMSSLVRFPMFGPVEADIAGMRLIFEILEKYKGQFEENTPAWYSFQEFYSEAKCKELSLRSRKAAYRLFHNLKGEKLSDIAGAVDEAYSAKLEVARKIRNKELAFMVEKHRDNFKSVLLELEKKLTIPHALCRVIFALPLTYGNTITGFYAVKDGKETLISKGNFKIANTGYEAYTTHFEWYFILPEDFDADSIKITAEGFTGTGISFVHIMTPHGEYIPDSIKSVTGEVANSAFILDRTDTFTYFGNPDGFHGAVDRKVSETLHTLVLNLKKVK